MIQGIPLVLVSLLLASSLPTALTAQLPEEASIDLKLSIEPCPSSLEIGDPQLTCQVVVKDAKEGINAELEGPPACTSAVRLTSETETFVIRFEIAAPQQIRLSGSKKPCSQSVAEAPECDLGGQPFFGFECARIDSQGGYLDCSSCTLLSDAFCYANSTESRIDLITRNVNFCGKGENIFLRYLIALKSKDTLQLNSQSYSRLYLVDPTVIQEPHCPLGCPAGFLQSPEGIEAAAELRQIDRVGALEPISETDQGG